MARHVAGGDSLLRLSAINRGRGGGGEREREREHVDIWIVMM